MKKITIVVLSTGQNVCPKIRVAISYTTVSVYMAVERPPLLLRFPLFLYSNAISPHNTMTFFIPKTDLILCMGPLTSPSVIALHAAGSIEPLEGPLFSHHKPDLLLTQIFIFLR